MPKTDAKIVDTDKDTGTPEIVWRGNPLLEPFLVPLAELAPYPDNPRRSDVARIAAIYARFGQMKPIVVDAGVVVAGNHQVEAVRGLGWTHIAALPNEFGDDEEARAYMLADNASSDNAGYDDALLVRHLLALREADALPGVGYSDDDLDEKLAALRRTLDTPVPPAARTPRANLGLKDVVLVYSADQHGQVEDWLRVVAAAKGTQGVSETFYAALELAALTIQLDAV